MAGLGSGGNCCRPVAEWQPVCAVAALGEDISSEYWVNGRPITLFLHQGTIYALQMQRG